MADVVVDTNVLVYAVDPSVPDKQRRAIEVLDGLVKARAGMLSSQALSEYISVVTRKIPRPISAERAYGNLEQFVQIWRILPLNGEVVLEAAQAVIRHKMIFWDAQIWAVAKLNGATEVLSEDFKDQQVIEGVRFRNPFAGLSS